MPKPIPTSGNPFIDEGHQELSNRIGEIGHLWKLGSETAVLEGRARDFRALAQRHFEQESVILRAHGVDTSQLHHDHHGLIDEIDKNLAEVLSGAAPWAEFVDALDRLLFDHEILEDSSYFASLPPASELGGKDSLVEWKPELETGIDWIDAHHRSLVETLNEVGRLPAGHGLEQGLDLMGRLRRHALYHFRDEEAQLQPGLRADEHAAHHGHLLAALDDVIEKLKTNRVDLPVVAREYLRYWLVEHIRETDRGDFGGKAA